MKPKLVLFDLDGTLLNTIADLCEAVNYALKLRNLPQHPLEEITEMVGHGARNLMRQALPSDQKNDEALIDAVLADFRAYYTAHIDVHTKPFPGIQNLLTKLHQEGVMLAVASNKFQEGTEHLIKEFFPEIPFVAILGNRPNFPLKPNAEVVGEVLRKTGVKKEEAVMVGDSDTDMETAANGGIKGIAVSWGYRNMKDLVDASSALRPFDGPQGPQAQGPRFITVVDSADELQKILLP